MAWHVMDVVTSALCLSRESVNQADARTVESHRDASRPWARPLAQNTSFPATGGDVVEYAVLPTQLRIGQLHQSNPYGLRPEPSEVQVPVH
jgi:hypothetical protein